MSAAVYQFVRPFELIVPLLSVPMPPPSVKPAKPICAPIAYVFQRPAALFAATGLAAPVLDTVPRSKPAVP